MVEYLKIHVVRKNLKKAVKLFIRATNKSLYYMSCESELAYLDADWLTCGSVLSRTDPAYGPA